MYNDNIRYPLVERPDLVFFKKTELGYKEYNEVESFSGGDSETDTYEYPSWVNWHIHT